MSEFTASNGIRIIRDPAYVRGRYDIISKEGDNLLTETPWLSGNDMRALREFFVKENDDRLGRWRDPENPDRVVSLVGAFGNIHVYDEAKREYSIFARPIAGGKPVRISTGDYGLSATAERYMDAHPEPKPWHDAKPGEVWVLEANEHSGPHGVVESDAFTGGVGFRNALSGKRGPGIHAPIIKSATRVYTPAVQS